MIRRLFRRARAKWCGWRGHAAPFPMDTTIGGQRVRLSVCSRCQVILAGDVLPTRKLRRLAKRTGQDPIELAERRLVGLDGRPLHRP